MSSDGNDLDDLDEEYKKYHRYTSHHDYELTSEDEEKYSELFKKLDVNGDGRIDVHDLSEAFKKMNLPQIPDHAKRFMDRTSSTTGEIDFADFLQYMTEHEKNLRLMFRTIDTNQDGIIDADEILISFHELGINISTSEAEKLLKRMDKGNTLNIDWTEWHDYLVLNPSSSIHDILNYWQHATIIDTGDGTIVFDDSVALTIPSDQWWQLLLSGGIAGAVSRSCTAPLDRLKILLQVHASGRNKLGIVGGIKTLVNEGGVRGLWRGNFINVLKVTPETAIKFFVYEKVKKLMTAENGELTLAKRFMSGSVAGALAQSVIYPIEVLKTRLALRRTGQYRGIVDCASTLYRTEGVYCFYRGFVPNLLGIVPYAGIDLAIYETLKSMYVKHRKTDPGPIVLLTCGTISSSCGQLTTYPLALVRTKLQAKASKLKLIGNHDKMSDILRHTIKTDGFRGLYHGLVPNFLKVAPAVSISYVVYEYTRKALRVTNT